MLGGSPHHSAASIIAAALNCTSASNSPPELFSLTTTSSSQLGNPFSPGIAQIAAAASPLNSAAAAVQQLANAHQLAAAIYNHSIPSPGGSAFASRQQQSQAPSAVTVAAAAAMAQQLANQQQQQQAAAIANIQSQFGGPASPAAAAFAQQLARLHTIANSSTNGSNSLDMSAQQQQQLAHQMLTGNGAPGNAGLDSLLSNQIQQQTQLLESAANLLANIHQQNPPPPPPQTHQTISHQQHQLIAAALQQQQSIQLQQQQQQQQAAALQAEQSQQIQAALLQQQRNVYGLNSAGVAREEVQSRQQLNSSSSSSSSSAQMPSTAVEQPVAATSAKSTSAAVTSEGGSVRRIRRRRPKEEAAAAAASQRRSSVSNGQKPDSPESSMGPSSVQQPTTPASADLMNVVKMEGIEDPESIQPFILQRRMLVTPINNNMAAFNPHQFGPQTPMFSNDGSPPSLLETKQQQREMRRESLEDVDGAGRTKTCKVCGDSATGYNFNVISCESCKAFFRRNALRPKEFKCPYANECEITNVSRRFCQKCRLRKCFEVGMKKEWILSDDQLKRRKNARIKGQLSKDGGNGPRTPSSNGSMAPATPSFGSGMPSSVSTAFSPPQQQQQPHFQQHSPQLQQQSQQQNHQFAVAAAALLQQQGQGEPSPLALAAAAAITKLAASPKQLSPGGSSILGTLDASPLASSAFCPLGNSPPEANKLNALNMMGGMEQQKVSPSGAHSPPPILPALQQANGVGHQQQQQQYDPAILRVAQQQLLQQAHLQQAAAAFAAQQQQQQQRRPSDGLLSLSPAAALLGAAQQQQQQMSPNGSNISASLIEQYKLMMKLGQQQQQQAQQQDGLLSVRTPSTASPYRSNELMSPGNRSTPGTGEMLGSTTPTITDSRSSMITSMPAGAAGMMASFTQEQLEQFKKLQMPGGAMPSFSQEQIEQYKKSQMASGSMPSYSQEMRELFMQQQIQKTINEELGMAQSPPETARSSPGVPSTPDAVLAEAEAEAEHNQALERQRKLTITRQYQLNSLEQRQMDAVKSAFASMDEELTRELLNNKKLHGLMTQEQTQSPIDMICLLDVVMRRFVKLAKRLPSFNELSAGGKFSLLKAAMMDLLTLRGASRLDTQKRCWKSPLLNTEIKCKIDMFDQLNDSEQKRRVMDFYQSLHDKLKTDQVANNLIVVSVLFIHFTDTELSAKDRALAEQHYYSHKHLLERYLQSVYGPEEAKDIYEKVPDALANLKSVTNKVRGLFPRDIDRKETDGTLVQEFDIIAKEGGGEGEKKPEEQKEEEEEEKMDVESSSSGKT